MTSFQMPTKDWEEVQAIPGNGTCVDCGLTKPEWASVTFGVVMCLQCSGAHRGLGTHISFVRSITMDSWTDKQLQSMKLGGNDKLNKALGTERSSIREKYDNDTAQLYKLQLKARVEGKLEPQELPLKTNTNGKAKNDQSRYQGIGSSPPPKPIKTSYISTLKWVATAAIVAGVWAVTR
mmetsp:Transcript_17307/g.25577  ORF Transcript_17307/g.25577 Transcript_17307/m.25577 type:complete len:179 (+) Transcript_17307:160-696(+)|eukprot:CAMPEP_0194214526 /NCGR_PEP_ID=MMETSP0156-20130528/15764_1 /TAXON_ID=33649 /ORGANISM="Thalassionema nitzschioides, Strain L26-B" /LENGTH=178 /DNA_ID=CAMNT_0038942803 /DNA_START=105 /DNA_END=641 /DNA_ORIENTATION=-